MWLNSSLYLSDNVAPRLDWRLGSSGERGVVCHSQEPGAGGRTWTRKQTAGMP